MNDIRHIRGSETGFQDAYRRSALDLHIARGRAEASFTVPTDDYYLDDKFRILAWMPGGSVQGFIIYSPSAFFYQDTDGEILDLWVAEAYRRSARGRHLAEEALRHLHGRIGFQVHADNSISLAFWESLAAAHQWLLKKETPSQESEIVCRLILTTPRLRPATNADSAAMKA